MHRIVILMTAAGLALGACSERPGASAAKPAAAQRGVLDPQLKALEKARGVEKTLADQAEAQRKEIDEPEKR